jgi:hypothetical protein
MQLALPLGRSALFTSLAGVAASAIGLLWFPWAGWLLAFFSVLTLIGIRDVVQRRRTVSRNYPILIHLRYFLESIGPEIRQYFIESDTDERPFSREQRALVYQRAKNVLDKKPFGTQLDVYGNGYEWINHSLRPSTIDGHDFRIEVGSGRAKPYSASVFNISAMSFGSLSPNAVLALNAGAARGGFFHDTGEGSISRYHRKHGGDLVWEIGSGYFGCRNPDGTFNEERFIENARLDQVRMIEIKLSQGAKPGAGGMLPGAKVNAEIAEARGVPQGRDVMSPASHSAFSTPIEFLLFIDRLRTLSGGKPVGFKLAIGHPWEWFGLVKAMLETGIHPDFIVVDGAEGGTAARGPDVGPQHAGRCRPARFDPHRCSRQDHLGIHDGAHHGHGRRLVQCGACVHVRPGLHPGQKLPQRPLPKRRRHPESCPLAKSGCRNQGAARPHVSPEHASGPGPAHLRRRLEPPAGNWPGAHHPTHFGLRSEVL